MINLLSWKENYKLTYFYLEIFTSRYKAVSTHVSKTTCYLLYKKENYAVLIDVALPTLGYFVKDAY